MKVQTHNFFVPMSGNGGGRQALSGVELARRRNLIMAYLAVKPEASKQEIARETGLTVKQVRLTIRRCEQEQEKREIFIQYGKCDDKLDDCGPCDGCLGPCAKCTKPVWKDDSRTKIVRDGKEIPLHLACKE